MASRSTAKHMTCTSPTHTEVQIFGPGVHTPTPKTGTAKLVKEHSSVVTGTVNPEGTELTTCVFEYGETESNEHSVPCAETVGQIGAGSKGRAGGSRTHGADAGHQVLLPARRHQRERRIQQRSRVARHSRPADDRRTGRRQDTSGEATVTAEIQPGSSCRRATASNTARAKATDDRPPKSSCPQRTRKSTP